GTVDGRHVCPGLFNLFSLEHCTFIWERSLRARSFMRHLTMVAFATVMAACSRSPEGAFTQTERGVVVTPAAGDAARVRLEVRSDRIMRVTAMKDARLDAPPSLMV